MGKFVFDSNCGTHFSALQKENKQSKKTKHDLDIAYPSKTQECILHVTRIVPIHIQRNVLREG